MTKLINRAEDVVVELLEGLTAVNPGLRQLRSHRVVVRGDAPVAGKVGIVSGGGSGHEPAHTGYVGSGMLSAAVAGEVFTSPSSESVLEAIRAVDSGEGVLVLIKNYMGDRLHFGEASDRARAEGRKVAMVVVCDDVAFSGALKKPQRRGIAGTVLVHKVAGAAAEAGLTLDEVARVAEGASERISTIGVALSAATLPGAHTPGFEVAPNTIALGLGIHGEAGIENVGLESCDSLVRRLLDQIVREAPFEPGERVALLVNNLGATPAMELSLVVRAALWELREQGCTVERAYVGTFLTAIDMAGVSISVLRHLDDPTVALLDADTDAPAWPRCAKARPNIDALTVRNGQQPQAHEQPLDVSGRILTSLFAALEDSASEIAELDRVAGDGDLGATFVRLAHAAARELGELSLRDPSSLLARLSSLASERMAGTSGALYAAGLRAAAYSLPDPADDDRSVAGITGRDWASAFVGAVDEIEETGGAVPGDRTMLDALRPAATAFSSAVDAGSSIAEAALAAANAAEEGATQTATMVPRKGRAAHLADHSLGHVDAGARAVAVWTRAIEKALRQ